MANPWRGEGVSPKGQEGDCHWAGRYTIDESNVLPSDSHLVRENLNPTRRVRVAQFQDDSHCAKKINYWNEDQL